MNNTVLYLIKMLNVVKLKINKIIKISKGGAIIIIININLTKTVSANYFITSMRFLLLINSRNTSYF